MKNERKSNEKTKIFSLLNKMLEIKKSTEFGKDPRTVRNNKKKYIALKYTDSITKY